MAKLLKLRRGTTTQHASFTGAEGEVTIDTTKDTAVVHDGSTQAGRPLLREDMANLPAGTIDNADVNASAAIAGTKISPDFGSQDITTTGKVKFANVYTNESDLPSASTYHGMFAHVHSTGLAYYAHGGNWIKLAKNDAPDFTGGIDVTGSVVATGNEHKFTSASGDTKLIIQADSGNNNSNENDTPYLLFRADGTLDEGAIFLDNNTLNIASTVSAAGGINFRTSTTDSGYDSAPTRMSISNTGQVDFEGNVDCNNGLDVTGNITCTGQVDGRDVAADGTKLDGIESGATADQTKSDIDALNINADQVDGMHANQFLAVAGDEATGDITFSGGAGSITVAGGSDMRIVGGTWTGEYTNGMKLQHNGNDAYIQYKGNMIHRDIGGNNRLTLSQSGDLTAVGNVTAYSDARLKTDIHTINNALGICGKLRGVSYKWIATDKPSIGVIAQEVEEVIPEVVLTNRDTNPSTGETTEIKSVDYGKIVGVLINAINELKAEVDALKKPKKKGGK